MQDIDKTNSPGPQRGRLLRTGLLANAIYSAFSGAALIVASPFLGEWIGLDGWVLLLAGIGLIGYAFVLKVARNQSRVLQIVGRLAVGADLLWVAGAALLIGIGGVLTAQGSIVLAILTGGVGVLAAVQLVGLIRMGGLAEGQAIIGSRP